jgi:aspartate aminotransferase
MALTISHRCLNIAPSLTLQIDTRAKEMAASGMDVVGFGAGEPDFPTPPHICEAAKEALDMGLTRYTPVAGTMELRMAITRKMERDHGLTYSPQEIIVSNGAKHSLFTIFQTILDPGDEVLIPTPCWVSYPELVRMAGGVPVFVPTNEENRFIPSNHDIASRITRRTKAIIITSPSNPNGSVWSREQLQFVGNLAVTHPFYIVSDEIYEKLLYDGRQHLSIAQLGEQIKDHTFIVNGVSKAYAMTGWRIGYCAAPRQEIAAMTAFQSQATSNANSIAQHAAAVALDGDQTCVELMRQHFEARRDLMVDRINSIEGISCLKPEGAFYVMMNIRKLIGRKFNGRKLEDSMDFAELLLAEKHVAVVPGIAFEAEGFCRLSYATGEDRINEGLNRIEAFINGLE